MPQTTSGVTHTTQTGRNLDKNGAPVPVYSETTSEEEEESADEDEEEQSAGGTAEPEPEREDHVADTQEPTRPIDRIEFSKKALKNGRKRDRVREREREVKARMLSAGYHMALEKQRLRTSSAQSGGSSELSTDTTPRKRIKEEETSSSRASLGGLSVPEFYSQYFKDVCMFMLKRNYQNPLVLSSLSESGFTKYELRSMKGLDQRVLTTRFRSLLSDDCRKPAQLESLAFAVFSASSAEWDTLNDSPIDVQ